MNRINTTRALALLSLLGAGPGCRPVSESWAAPAGSPPTTTKTKEASMHDAQALTPLTIDLKAHPHLQFRIDAFSVPAAARAEFEAAMHRNLAFIGTLPGFMNHMVFEKSKGPTTFDFVTIAVWESPEVIAAAGEKVRAHYASIGFDMPAMLARLGITASLGYYRAPLALQ
jgi:heme-degrading monooxygenase HmoA